VYVEVIAFQLDQPKRQAVTCTMAGNSRYHSRFGYSFNCALLAEKVPSCNECYKLLCTNGSLANGCLNCFSWKMPEDSRILFGKLSAASKNEFDQLLKNGCAVNEAVAQLNASCVASNHNKVIIDNARHLLGYTMLLNEKSNAIGDNPNSLNDLVWISKLCSNIAASMQANPELYKQPPDPAVWNKLRVTMDHFPKANMHILFLGIEKAVLTKAQYFVTKCHLRQAHLAALQGILEPICVMALVWCKALPFNKDGGTGAKVSENYLADARLMPWFSESSLHVGGRSNIYSSYFTKGTVDCSAE
jgi:hypothetical protein